MQRAAIAWGGLWAQMLGLAVAVVALAIAGRPDGAAMQQLVGALTVGNVWLMAINLLPIPPLDGAEAWPLFPLLWRHVRDGRRRRRRARATRSTLRTLERLDALDEGDVPPSPEKKAAVDKILADLKRPPARTSRE